MEPEHDFPPGTAVRAAYVIASIPRSGSSLLTTALWNTSLAGAPNEYLNPLQRRMFERRWGRLPLPIYMERLVRYRTSPNGVFGLKIHYHHLRSTVWSRGYDLPELLGPAQYITTTRSDQVAQAVSLELAHQTGRWSSLQLPRDRRPVYNAAALERRLRFIRTSEEGWDRFFDVNAITPLRLTYEEIAGRFRAAVRSVLDLLWLPDTSTVPIPGPTLRPLTSRINDQWTERFMAEPDRSAFREPLARRVGHRSN